jgi:AraC-like DNA-binding protein
MATVGFGDKVYTATKLAAVMDSLSRLGVQPEEALRGVELSLEDLRAPETRISLDQMVQMLRNAMTTSRDRHLPFKIGSNIHVSAYGMYGFAILCGADFRKTMDFAVAYHLLAAPLAEISFSESAENGIWTIRPLTHPSIDARLLRFITELQLGIHLSLHRDIMGAAFKPVKLTMTYGPSNDFGIAPELVGCPVSFGESANQLVFASAWLNLRPTLGNQTTYTLIRATCDELLAEMSTRAGAAGKVRKALLQDVARRPTLPAIAKMLRTTTRTLRRKLEEQNTSFRALQDELRAHLALKYLRDTTMTNDDIAFALGFSDAANFRQAFRRWTAQTPREFRAAMGAGSLRSSIGRIEPSTGRLEPSRRRTLARNSTRRESGGSNPVKAS